MNNIDLQVAILYQPKKNKTPILNYATTVLTEIISA